MTALQVLNLVFLFINCLFIALRNKAKRGLSGEQFFTYLMAMQAAGIIGIALAIGVIVELATGGNGAR